MEIHAVGDRITVTVNGRVILDGDIREACKGHNVSRTARRIPIPWTARTIPDSSIRKAISVCWATVRASSSATCACWT